MSEIEVKDINGLDPSKIYIINVKNKYSLDPDDFGRCLMNFVRQLEKLNIKFAINTADHLELTISEIIPNNKFILNLSGEKDEGKE